LKIPAIEIAAYEPVQQGRN